MTNNIHTLPLSSVFVTYWLFLFVSLYSKERKIANYFHILPLPPPGPPDALPFFWK